MDKPPPAISFEGVEFSYERRPVLLRVNFQLTAGKFVAIIGPNGGGKTTLLKLGLGLLKPSSGKVRVFDGSPRQMCQRMAYVPQSLVFDKKFPMSVQELVLGGRVGRANLFGHFSKKDKEVAAEVLDQLGLADLRAQPFGSLSGGQAQRALIARALVSEPEILLLDEPTGMVDTEAESRIYGLLEELRGDLTILMVTHHIRSVLGSVDEVLCVQNEVTTMSPRDVCEHFSMGLYHPRIQEEDSPQ